MNRSPWFKVTIAAYALVMIAVTVLRSLQAGNDDGSRAEELAIGIVMLATTCGGAVLAESIMSRRGPSVRLAKERRNLQRRLRDAERRQRRAQTYVEHFERNRVRQRERIARDKATYLGTHEYTKATTEEDQ
jgi:negative regulator of sigma E activity